MATTTVDDHKNDRAPRPVHRDEFEHVESLDHLGLVRDIQEPLTPVDRLFNPKEDSGHPKPHQREII